MLYLPDEEVGEVFHGLGAIAQSARLYVKDVLIIFRVIGVGITEKVDMDEKEEWQREIEHLIEGGRFVRRASFGLSESRDTLSGRETIVTLVAYPDIFILSSLLSNDLVG